MFAREVRANAQEAVSMWPAWVVAAIALAAASCAKARHRVCCRVVPERRGQQKEVHLKALGGIYFDDECRATRSGRNACYWNVENQNYAKQKSDSGLIALDIRPIAGLGRRSIHPGRGHIFRENRL
jgi:hypothetical protein